MTGNAKPATKKSENQVREYVKSPDHRSVLWEWLKGTSHKSRIPLAVSYKENSAITGV